MPTICNALDNWEKWTPDQRAEYLDLVIEDQMAEWDCKNVKEVIFDATGGRGFYERNNRTVHLPPYCRIPTTSGFFQECTVSALHEAGVQSFPSSIQDNNISSSHRHPRLDSKDSCLPIRQMKHQLYCEESPAPELSSVHSPCLTSWFFRPGSG